MVVYPEEHRDDVVTSLWAWTNFGGIGARPRRGCGALFCDRFAPTTSEKSAIDQWFKDALKLFSEPAKIESIPRLVSGPLTFQDALDPVAAWRKVVALIQKFRQGEGIGRKPRPRGSERVSQDYLPGPSYWPEAETIRALQGVPSHFHGSCHYPEDAFPRAAFGLPICFQFKDPDETQKTEVRPEPYERMASPIIIRPLAFGDGSKALPMILRLEAPVPEGLRLEIKEDDKESRKGGKPRIKREKKTLKKETFGENSIVRSELSTYDHSPMKGRSDSGSALEAFMTYAKQAGYTEVGV